MRDHSDLDDIDVHYDEDVIFDFSKFDSHIFGEPDADAGDRLKDYDPNTDLRNPEELGSYFEGDMLIPMPVGRNGYISVSKRWPNATIPVFISSNFNVTDQNKIRNAMTYLHQRTCLRFVVKQIWHTDWVEITATSTGCYASVGRIGGRQVVNLQSPQCLLTLGTIIHELIHVAGFVHESSRYDRDSWVYINLTNVQPTQLYNFDKSTNRITTTFSIPYDYGSVMHLSSNAFSSNGQPTVIPYYNNLANDMGQRIEASTGDLIKINRMYSCTATTLPSIKDGQNVQLTSRYNLYTDSMPVLVLLIRDYLFKNDLKNQQYDQNGNSNSNQEEILHDVRNSVRFY